MLLPRTDYLCDHWPLYEGHVTKLWRKVGEILPKRGERRNCFLSPATFPWADGDLSSILGSSTMISLLQKRSSAATIRFLQLRA